MILVTYGWHRIEGAAYLMGRILNVKNKDPYFKFFDLSVFENRDDKALAEKIADKCEELGDVDLIVDIHGARSWPKEYRPSTEDVYFYVTPPASREGEAQPYSNNPTVKPTKELKKFLSDIGEWTEKLEKYGSPKSEGEPKVKAKSNPNKRYKEFTDSFGKYIHKIIDIEIMYPKGFQKVNKKLFEAEAEMSKKENEYFYAGEKEKKEKRHEVLEAELGLLSKLPRKYAKELEKLLEDLSKLLKIMKEYFK